MGSLLSASNMITNSQVKNLHEDSVFVLGNVIDTLPDTCDRPTSEIHQYSIRTANAVKYIVGVIIRGFSLGDGRVISSKGDIMNCIDQVPGKIAILYVANGNPESIDLNEVVSIIPEQGTQKMQ